LKGRDKNGGNGIGIGRVGEEEGRIRRRRGNRGIKLLRGRKGQRGGEGKKGWTLALKRLSEMTPLGINFTLAHMDAAVLL
jgi:hypothetical protein